MEELEALTTISHDISMALDTIMMGTATSLPEVAVLPSMDVAMLGLMVNLGLVGRWMEQGRDQGCSGSLCSPDLDHGPYSNLCHVLVQAEADIEIMLDLLMAVFVPLLGRSFILNPQTILCILVQL